jgi:hypothetical protein
MYDLKTLKLEAYRGAGGKHMYVGTEGQTKDLATVDVLYDGKDNDERIREAGQLAVLFAASPNLLEALQDLIAAHEAQLAGDTQMDLPWGTARAAIAKAQQQ